MYYKYLRLLKHKGLIPADLTALDHINVFCGPNNSGKTTILECIENSKLHQIGRLFTNDDGEAISKKALDSLRLIHHNYISAFRSAVLTTLGENRIWYRNEWPLVLEQIQALWRNSVGGHHFDPGALHGDFNSSFANDPKVVLIPAKRSLEAQKPLETSEKITSVGSGILNYLFKAKNQSDGSELKNNYLKILQAFRDVSNGYEFELNAGDNNMLNLLFKLGSRQGIRADDCGLGLRDVLIILYFAIDPEFEIVLIEEPENHLHPEIQRRLIECLKKITRKQFFLSTHSSIFLNTQFADKVFVCRMTDKVEVESATSKAALLSELGYSIADNLVSDLVILCEGPTDKAPLEALLRKMGLTDKYNIKMWALGGDIMDQHDLSAFRESKKVIALIDSDPGSSAVRKRFCKNCGELEIPVHQLKGYSLENYFSLTAISSVTHGAIPNEVKAIDMNKRISDQLGFDVKRNGGKIVEAMSLNDIKGTDLEEFLDKVKALLEN